MKHDTPGGQHAHRQQGAHRPAARASAARRASTPTSSGPGDIGAVAKLKETRAGDWLAARDEPTSPCRRSSLPNAGHGLRDRAQDQGRRGQGVHRAAPPAGGGPDDRRPPRPADRRADRGRPLADPRRGDRRAHARPLRRRGQPQAAAGALPGDDPPGGQGPRSPQEAVRRARPVRRLPHRDRAAAGRRRLRVRQRDQGRRDPDELHPRGREGHRRGDGRPGPSPAIRSRACACASSTASTTRSTRRRWRSRSPARWP